MGVNCKVYQGVTYHDLYPGIDIRYYTNNGQLKYDLIIHPGADVSRIRMRYDGVNRLSTEEGSADRIDFRRGCDATGALQLYVRSTAGEDGCPLPLYHPGRQYGEFRRAGS